MLQREVQHREIRCNRESIAEWLWFSSWCTSAHCLCEPTGSSSQAPVVPQLDPGVARQIADLVQLLKGLTELQAALTSGGIASSSAGGATQPTEQDEQGSAPMEVDRDTGGVRHHKAEQYLPKIPMLAFEKMNTRSNEINYWSEFVESVNSWLALLDDFYPMELYRTTVTNNVVRQDGLERGPAARSARFYHLLRQSLGTVQRGLDIVRQAEQEQLGAACVVMKLSESSTWSLRSSLGWRLPLSARLCLRTDRGSTSIAHWTSTEP